MNIFVLDMCPRKAASMHCDIHVGKLAMEASQLLSVAHHRYNPKADTIKGLCYPTHVNHPCALWTRQCKENYEWLFELYVGLHDEYMYRFGTMHGNYMRMYAIKNTPPLLPSNGGSLTTHPLCMPDIYKVRSDASASLSTDKNVLPDVVASYRKYYKYGKEHLTHRYTKREKPAWLTSQ